jgi:transposase
VKKYIFTEEEKQELQRCRKQNRDKKIDKRLEALAMRAEGKGNREISEKTGFHTQYITVLVSRYKANGIESITGNHYHGNRRNLSFEQEAQLLEPYRQAAEAGQIVSVSEIKAMYLKAVGHDIGSAQIYRVLHRHGWRKIMPRSRHPKKASEEVIETSKKLTAVSKN